MLRSMMFLTASLVLASLAMPASARKSVLTTADQNRIVCVPLRDKVGALAGGQMCKTGRQWEIALAKLRARHVEWTPDNHSYLTDPGYFRTAPSILQSLNPR